MGHKGFTLIELAIVLAVIAIVGAVILPNFLTTTDRARLKSDIQSARVLQNAADLYDAEQPVALPRSIAATDVVTLVSGGYLTRDAVSVQTAGAKWEYDTGNIKVNIHDCTDKVKELVSGLDSHERAMILNR